jgi:EAL domain-containing protein (putative c-di-GMP-specific phosphodiesterase class I)
MSANLSARQLQDPTLAADVRDAIARTGIPPGSLILELTERVMMQDTDLAILRMHELRRIGVRLAIDDFGTGYSSLNYIRQFPINIIKIDRSFIQDVTEGGQVSALTAAIIDLADVLDLDPIAEGIETAEQLERLRELGCRFGQGFYFQKPVPGAAVEEQVRRQAAAARRDGEDDPRPPEPSTDRGPTPARLRASAPGDEA